MPQLKFLAGHGYQVYAVCSPGMLTEEIKKEGIRLHHIPIPRKLFTPVADILALVKLYWYFKKEKFDVVHTHAPKPGFLGQLAAKMAGVPVIINTIHGLYFTEHSSWLRRAAFIAIERVSAKCSTLIFSQNQEDMETIVKEGIATREKLRYLGNGINMRRFDPEKFSQRFIEEKKKTLGIPKGKVVIGTTGRLVWEKGYREIFLALQEVIKRYPNIFFVAVGPQDKEKRDGFGSDAITAYGLENYTLFLGERKDMEELYPCIDLFVFASHREGFPRSVLEAMAMERPIIATNIRGCREEITDRQHGLLVPPKNSSALAQAIISLLQDVPNARMLAKNARIRALAEFDEMTVFNRLLKGYETCFEKNH